MGEQARCQLCGRPIGVQVDPLSGDCGGDCWGCIGAIEAQMGEPTDTNISIGFVAKEVRWGWREMDGTPKPQTFFLEGGPRHIRVRWIHTSVDDPIELWSELDQQREEVRKIEIWSDGRIGYAFDEVEFGGTRLGEGSIPQLHEIAADPQFEPEAISLSDFEECWTANVR